MATCRKFLALSGTDRLFIAEAAAWLMLVWLGLRIVPFLALRRILDRYARTREPRERREPVSRGERPDASATRVIDRIAWAVRVVADRFPGRKMTCLVQALAADAMLERHGHASELRLGVRALAPFEAHAWVECEGSVVIGRLEDLADYAVLSARARS